MKLKRSVSAQFTEPVTRSESVMNEAVLRMHKPRRMKGRKRVNMKGRKQPNSVLDKAYWWVADDRTAKRREFRPTEAAERNKATDRRETA